MYSNFAELQYFFRDGSGSGVGVMRGGWSGHSEKGMSASAVVPVTPSPTAKEGKPKMPRSRWLMALEASGFVAVVVIVLVVAIESE
jgi:hypothetical protein